MKKILCICMIATLCVGVSGCSKNQTIYEKCGPHFIKSELNNGK